MSVVKEFRCDICNGWIASDADGIGIAWTGNGREFRNAAIASSGVDKHLCILCIESLKALFAANEKLGWVEKSG